MSNIEGTEDKTLEEILSVHAKEREERIKKVIEQKKELLKKAKEVIAEADAKNGKSRINGLLTEWKALDNFRTDEENSLWDEFQKTRKEFDGVLENYRLELENRRKQYAENKEKKQALVDETKTIKVPEDVNWKQLSEKLNQMLEQWKAIGFAGADDNDRLWEEFNAARKIIFDKRAVAFEEINAKREEVAKVKKVIIEEAKTIAATKDYSKENTEKMKSLDIRWKEAGSAGKEKEDELWNEFVEAKEAFWQEKQAIADAKRKEWTDKKNAIISSKKKQVKDLNEQIDSLKKSIHGTLDIPKITRVSGWIEEKQEIVANLRKEIKELEQRQ